MTISSVRNYRLTKDLPKKIPIFPLNGVILLPRSTLPLNIFEPRYLEMTDDVLAGKRIIGMVQPDRNTKPDLSAEELIPVRKTGCAGRVTEFSEVDDGRVLITLSGICRFHMVSEDTDDRPYRTVTANYDTFEDDLLPGVGEQKIDRKNFLNVLKTYLDIHELNADWESIHQSTNEFRVNTLSIISPYGAEEKQALLEAEDLKQRSEVLIALAEMDIASGSDGSGTPIQ